MIGILIVAAPVLLYLTAALNVRKAEAGVPANFFTAHRKASLTVFATSAVAYAFQMSTIFPFLTWGASGEFLIPIVNSFFWGVGIVCFQASLRNPDRFVGRDQSLHGLLGDSYGSSVRQVASYLTIIGFLGFIVAELYFGSQVILAIMPVHRMIYVVMIGVSLIVLAYVAYGGQLSSIRTDQLQLALSYVGFFGLLAYFLYVILDRAITTDHADRLFLIGSLFAIPAVIWRRGGRFVGISFAGRHGAIISKMLNYVVVSLFAIIVLLMAILLSRMQFLPYNKSFWDLTGFGWPGLFSLILLPVCFQFVDLTNWQRLLAVRPPEDEESRLSSIVRTGLLTYALESPFTWLASLLFGLLAVKAVAGIDANKLLIDLPRQLLASKSGFDHFAAYLFILSVVSVMLSTVDSFLIGIIYTFVYDSYPTTRSICDSQNSHLIEQNSRKLINVGRAFAALALALGIIALAICDRVIPSGGDLFINLLLAFYSAQLSFFPLVLGTLYLKHLPTSFWANLSILLGGTSGILLGIYAVIWNQRFAWYPVLVCLVTSCIVYGVGLICSPNKKMQTDPPL